MQNRFSVKTVGVLVILVYTIGISFINLTFALICYECEDDTCDVGPVYLRECELETSVCVLFKDATGRALRSGPDYVYRRSCGVATYPNNKSEWNCTQYTQNFDKCICREDLCNGDESLMELTTTTRLYPPGTTESGEDSGEHNATDDSAKRQSGRQMMPGKFKGRDFGDTVQQQHHSGEKIRRKCNKTKSPYGRSGSGGSGGYQQGRSGGYQGRSGGYRGRSRSRDEDYYSGSREYRDY